MKKLLLLTLPLLLTSCVKEEKTESYEFKVESHLMAVMTSEVQEETHDIYLAECVRGANYAYIEVPLNDNKDTLLLTYTGYIIEYHLQTGIKVSNNGWKLCY